MKMDAFQNQCHCRDAKNAKVDFLIPLRSLRLCGAGLVLSLI
jgi:hypothetical protein